jgi:ferredoxin
MPDIEQMIDIISKVESVDLTVHEERCAAVRNRNSHCHRCAEACVSGCISVQDNQIVIDQSKCIGCGTCATVCPTAAIEARHPDDNELMLYARRSIEATDGRPVFACSELCAAHADAYDKGAVVELACLGRLDESLYCYFIENGAHEIHVACGDCATCRYHKGRDTIDLVCETMDTLAQTWGFARHISCTQEMPAHVKTKKRLFAQDKERVDGMSRRDFFTQLKNGAADIALDTVEEKILGEKPAVDESDHGELKYAKVMNDGTLPHYIPNRRERLLDTLDRLGEAKGETLKTRLWGKVHIDLDLCSSCRMCATFCPTGALTKFDDSEEELGIEQYPADCVQCRLCQDICMKQCLTLSDEVPLKELVEGVIERVDMSPLKYRPNDPKQIYHHMYDLLGGGQIYER